MGGATRSDCAFLLILGALLVGFVWTIDPPDALIWSFRIGGVLTIAVATGLLLKLMLRSDLQKD